MLTFSYIKSLHAVKQRKGITNLPVHPAWFLGWLDTDTMLLSLQQWQESPGSWENILSARALNRVGRMECWWMGILSLCLPAYVLSHFLSVFLCLWRGGLVNKYLYKNWHWSYTVNSWYTLWSVSYTKPCEQRAMIVFQDNKKSQRCYDNKLWFDCLSFKEIKMKNSIFLLCCRITV